jgi:anaerobic ribonucleoside-triphosphate reductase activating protein
MRLKDFLTIRISKKIDYNGSLTNGPGVRVVVFLQGCNIKCKDCHNQSTWDENYGEELKVSDLAKEIVKRVKNKKVTISGGEPFFQADATIELVRLLFAERFDICLYTGKEFFEVKQNFPEVLPMLHYIKVGCFKKHLRCTTVPYIGSKNQKFLTLKDGESNEEVNL